MTSLSGRRRRRCVWLGRRRGSVLIQIGIALPVLLLGILGVMETGRVLYARNTLQFAAEETARFAMINTGWNEETLAARLRGRLPGINPNAVGVSVRNESVSGVLFVAIRASMPQHFVSFLGINAVTITGYARVPAGT